MIVVGNNPLLFKGDAEVDRYLVLSEAYEAYTIWCKREGEKPLTSQAFGKRLAQLIPEYHSKTKFRKIDGKTVRVVVDLSHRSSAEY